MSFTSISFIILFSTVCVLLLALDRKCIRKHICEHTQLQIKHLILLAASYVFYGWWDYRFCFLMALLSVIAWLSAKMIAENKHRKLFTVIGIVVPLIVLAFFKYFNFFIHSFAQAFNIQETSTLNIILPVGISFYTFQSMSYTIDVIRGNVRKHSLLEVSLYIAFFPQLVAGPIVKASDYMPQLQTYRPLRLQDFHDGIQIFLFGFIKKLVIADNLSVFVDDVFAKPLAFSSLTVILAVISYSIQIYCDFSGYSDMAIGAARCLGYDFRPNFNMPYISKNVTEFWKRWHISLSGWLQEYLYIPLGGSRKGTARRYINLMVTMILGGLWHGADYTFVFWGLLHGCALCIHKMYMQWRKGRPGTVLGSIFSSVLTYVFVCICWVFFRSPNFQVALDVLRKMFIWSDGITQIFSWSIISVVAVALCTFLAYLRSKRENKSVTSGYYLILDLNTVKGLFFFFLTIMLAIALAYTNANPFIYFQF